MNDRKRIKILKQFQQIEPVLFVSDGLFDQTIFKILFFIMSESKTSETKEEVKSETKEDKNLPVRFIFIFLCRLVYQAKVKLKLRKKQKIMNHHLVLIYLNKIMGKRLV